MLINSAGFENRFKERPHDSWPAEPDFIPAFGGVDVAHGKGSIASYFF